MNAGNVNIQPGDKMTIIFEEVIVIASISDVRSRGESDTQQDVFIQAESEATVERSH